MPVTSLACNVVHSRTGITTALALLSVIGNPKPVLPMAHTPALAVVALPRRFPIEMTCSGRYFCSKLGALSGLQFYRQFQLPARFCLQRTRVWPRRLVSGAVGRHPKQIAETGSSGGG